MEYNYFFANGFRLISVTDYNDITYRGVGVGVARGVRSDVGCPSGGFQLFAKLIFEVKNYFFAQKIKFLSHIQGNTINSLDSVESIISQFQTFSAF